MTYRVPGNSSTLTGTFTNTAGVAADPTTVSVIVEEPDGTTTTYVYGVDAEVTRTGTGVYTYTQIYDSAGQWKIVFQGVGNSADAVDEYPVTIHPSILS